MTLEYHQHAVAWLKVVPVAEVAEDADLASALRSAGSDPAQVEEARRCLVQVFLEDHFNQWTPEDSPYSLFLRGAWRRAERSRMEREIETIFAATDAGLRRHAAERAAARADARAAGHELHEPDDGSPPPFEDYATLRNWFVAELWPGQRSSCFVFEAPPGSGALPAVIAVDDLLIGVLWIQR